jgi:hypothetical protein
MAWIPAAATARIAGGNANGQEILPKQKDRLQGKRNCGHSSIWTELISSVFFYWCGQFQMISLPVFKFTDPIVTNLR